LAPGRGSDSSSIGGSPIVRRTLRTSLLREIGLTKEAKAEGTTALSVLDLMPQLDMSRHDSRHLFRALARAHEGAEHDGLALT
jgi:hypothetical protein